MDSYFAYGEMQIASPRNRNGNSLRTVQMVWIDYINNWYEQKLE